MEFRETLLAAQRNQQQKSSESSYYKARFDPPKKEQKPKDKLSSNIQKFLAKKEEEERQKKLETIKKRDDLLAMRDPKAMRKIQKSLKVFKSANKSVLEDAIDHEHTAITREGPDQPDQDDYGYESQASQAIYLKMMEKYSNIKDEPKFPTSSGKSKKDLDGTRDRVKLALQHVDDHVPHKRRRKTDSEAFIDKDSSPPPKSETEKKKDEKPKFRKPAPPPMDFNQLLKLAEQKKLEPLETGPKKVAVEPSGPDRLMTKKQRRDYEEEMRRKARRQERLDAEAGGGKKVKKEEIPIVEKKPEQSSGFGRIPKIGEKNANSQKNDSPKSSNKVEKDRIAIEKEKIEKLQREKARIERENAERARMRSESEKERLDRERLEKLKAEREKIERDIERLNRDRERLEKSKIKLESNYSTSKSSKEQDQKKNIDLKSQNTYRIDKTGERKLTIPSKTSDSRHVNGHSSHGKLAYKNDLKDKVLQTKQKSLSERGDSPKMNGSIKQDNGKRLDQSRSLPPKGRPDDRRPDDRRLDNRRPEERRLDNTKPDARKPDDKRPGMTASAKNQAQLAKPKISNSFNFDQHVNSLKNGQHKSDVKQRMHPNDIKKKQQQLKRRVVDSESEHDSEMDDFIDDGDEDIDVSSHIKEIFGYDRERFKNLDDDDDPNMESSFTQQMKEEYISKKKGLEEDLEDMKMEKLMKQRKKKRRISDD